MNFKSYLAQRTIFSIVLMLFVSNVYTQSPKVKFGKPDMEEMTMTRYEKDTGAVAVVLYDYGEFNPAEFTFERYTRIKILKKEGYIWANERFYSDNSYTVKGFTHNLENGKIVSTKLEKDQIFKVEFDPETYLIKFTMPDVKVGSLVEFRISFRAIPRVWNFQLPIPVKWSELFLPEKSHIDLHKTTYGYENILTMGENHWYARDVAAVTEEPYLTSVYNFVSKMEFELRSYADKWEDVNRYLAESYYFGQKMQTTFYMRKAVSDIKSKNLPSYQRMKAAYEFIQKQMKWNEQNYIYGFRNTGDVYQEHTGNTADINLMLIALLQDLKLDVKPVVLSTRDNGVLHPVHPSIYKLNYVIAQVKIDTMNYLLDATDPLLTVGLLPFRCLNGFGRTINVRDFTGDWCDLTPITGSVKITAMDLKLNNQGEMSGKISKESRGYAAHDLREEIQKAAGVDKYIEEYQANNKGLKIKSFSFENVDSLYKPVKSQFDVEMIESSIVTSDKIFFDPMFFEQTLKNPFKSDTRSYPVDFGYVQDQLTTLRIEIPEGYMVEEMPKPLIVKSPDNSLKLTYTSTCVGNIINFSCKLTIGKTLYLPKDYDILKDIYNKVITKESEQIVLKKTI